LKRLLPALVCGFGAAVLSAIPGLKNFGCCLIVPAAAYIALLLDVKINHFYETIRPSKAVAFGILTGIFAAAFSTLFETLITYLLRTNDFVTALPELDNVLKGYMATPGIADALYLLKQVGKEITVYGFSALYVFLLLMNSLIVNFIFGIAGGLFGMYFINQKSKNQQL